MDKPPAAYIAQFRFDTPPYVKTQDESIQWLAAEYARRSGASGDGSQDVAHFEKCLRRVGAKPPQVQSRAHYLPDFALSEGTPLIFKPDAVAPLEERMRFFDETALGIFRRLFAKTPNFDELFHVTCTGYVAPSAAQKWATATQNLSVRVRHIYHMGCYAALPALHQAAPVALGGGRVEVCHTELCTLHLQPTLPSLEEMVVQTLFADGACAYAVSSEVPQGDGFKYLKGHEEQIAESATAMGWGLSSGHFAMTLAKDVPSLVKGALPGVLKRFLGDSSLLTDPQVVWAIHPGGPRIIEEIQQAFNLSADQICYSQKVLRERGNMSSATLPHIWQEVLNDKKVTAGTPVLSMAFGPGLTISLALLEVVR